MKTITLRAKSTLKVTSPEGASCEISAGKGDSLLGLASAAHQRAGGSKLVELDKLVSTLREEAENAQANGYQNHAEAIRDTADRLESGELEV